MDPVTLGVAGLSAGASVYGASSANASANSASQRSIRFQREMARSKYQYLVEDLQKAGINPMLAVGSASTGVGGASASQPQYVNPAGGAAQVAATIANIKADVKQKEKAAEKMSSESQESQTRKDYYTALKNKTEQEKRLVELMIPEATNRANMHSSPLGKYLPYADLVHKFLPGMQAESFEVDKSYFDKTLKKRKGIRFK